MIEQVAIAFMSVFADWQVFLSVVVGTAVGLVVGCIPGLTYGMAVGLMIPLTFVMPPIASIAMLISTTKAGIFGGSVSAILIGTPGTPAASATILDGYELTKKGQQGKALKVALYSSALADLFSNLVLVFVSYPLAKVALKFGPPEYFTVILFSLTIIGSFAGKSIFKGFLCACLGLMISIIGLDPMDSLPRWDFGFDELMEGFNIIPVMVGMFAIREVFIQAENPKIQTLSENISIKNAQNNDQHLSWGEFKGCLKSIAKSAGVGTFIGALPGLGASVAAWVGYGMAKNSSKHPETFGKGAIEGVAASEAANNAVDGANLIPLLALGIPGNIAAALLLGAFMIQGITPGPMLFKTNAVLVYSIFGAGFLAIICYFVFGYYFIRVASYLTKIPKGYLFPSILVVCFAGAYSISNSIFDIYVMLIFGILGYFMFKFGFPLPALLIAYLLGPSLERSFRQSLIMSEGDVSVFFISPICLLFIVLTILSIILTARKQLRSKRSIS